MHSPWVLVCAAGGVEANGKVVVGLVVEGVGNSKVDANNRSSGLRGGMGSCRHMAVGRCGSNRSISSSRCGRQQQQQQYVHRQQQPYQQQYVR